MAEFGLKDSGERQTFSSGMIRDTTEGKTNFLNVFFGPMLTRWATHLTKGRQKYPDVAPGTPNWTLAQGTEEYLRAKESATRHFFQWLRGDRDEDHAAAVFFNVNLAEYVLGQTEIDPALGAAVVSSGCAEEDGPETPEGFEFTGEFRIVQPGEWSYIPDYYYDAPAHPYRYSGHSTVPRRILRKTDDG